MPKGESKENPDPLNARLVNLKEGDKEFQSIVDFFKASLGNSTRNLKNIMSVRRIESLSLWQSFVAKRRQLETRAVAEGKDEEYAKAYEQVWMFHGTAPDVRIFFVFIQKQDVTIILLDSAFENRSFPKFARRASTGASVERMQWRMAREFVSFDHLWAVDLLNARITSFHPNSVKHDLAPLSSDLDFANNSFYSNRYAHADNKGVKRMFLCRVVVGEFCLGRNGQLTPDIRDKKRDLLYDATTDSMDSKKRDMYVVYHDAQAYPEYLLEYTMSS